MRRAILLAGPSGSGKSRLAATVGCPRLNLDDFYLDADHPGLPHTLGIVDWDDAATWDGAAAVRMLEQLCLTGRGEVPIYDIASSRRTGSRVLDLGDAPAFIAEGLFAPEVVPACRAAGMDLEALYLDRPRALNMVFRFLRDVAEHRKPIGVLIRRGAALWRAEPAIRAHALAQGCRAVNLTEAARVVSGRVVHGSLTGEEGTFADEQDRCDGRHRPARHADGCRPAGPRPRGPGDESAVEAEPRHRRPAHRRGGLRRVGGDGRRRPSGHRGRTD